MVSRTGYYDLHIHTAPDICARKLNDVELAERMMKAGFAGFAIKNHYSETASRARLLKEAYPTLDIVGGIVLNRSNGGLNPYAVENSAKLGGRFVWMPTMDARSYNQKKGVKTDLAKCLSVVDSEGNLLHEVYEILEIIAANDMILATGHISAYEGLKVLQAAKSMHVNRMVVTHADSINDFYTSEEQLKAVQLGALVEHSFYSVYKNQIKIEEVIHCIKKVGIDNVYVSTDFGQVSSPYPDVGFNMYLDMLEQGGLKDAEIDVIARDVPRNLVLN